MLGWARFSNLPSCRERIGEASVSELKSWFLRNVFEAAERQVGAAAMASLHARLPPRVSAHGSLELLRASPALETVPLEEGEELLLSLDSLLGDGSGKLLQGVGLDLATRMLSQDGSVARSGDLAGTVARLQAFVEHPFVDVPLLFELKRNPAGFTLTVGVLGHSRATRALRHLTIGAIVAAERFARQVGAELLKIGSENIADRSIISAIYMPPEQAVAEPEPPRSRRIAPSRAPEASLSAEVERILQCSSSRAESESALLHSPKRESSRPRSKVPSIRASQPPQAINQTTNQQERQPPASATLRVASVPAARGPAVK